MALLSLLCPTDVPFSPDSFVPYIDNTGELTLVSAARTRKRAELKGAILKTDRFMAAKQTELDSLLLYKVYQEVPLEPSFDVYSCRFVCSEKKALILGDALRAKARLVAQNFCVQGSPDGQTKTDLGCVAPTSARSSFKLVLHTLLQMGWVPKTVDVRTAFLQGEPLLRDVYIRPPPEANVPPDRVWKLLKALYGLVDAPDRWFAMVKKIFCTYMAAQQSKVDPAVFYWLSPKRDLIGLVSTHVDDFFFGGTPEWEAHFETSLRSHVDVGATEDLRKQGSLTYAGLTISYAQIDGEEVITLDLEDYVSKLESIPLDSNRHPDDIMNATELTLFRGLVGGLLWSSTQTRPTDAFAVSELASFVGDPRVKHLSKGNEVLGKIRKTPYKLIFRKLNPPLKLCVHNDASWGNIGEGGSQGGAYLTIAEDKPQGARFNSINWASRRIRRAIRSTFGAETLSLVDGIDSALVIRYLYNEITGRHTLDSQARPLPIDLVLREDVAFPSVPLQAITDCRSIFDHVSSSKQAVTEKRLMVDLSNLKDDLHKGVIRDLCWCITGHQLADALTKDMSGRSLIRSIQSGVLPDYSMSVSRQSPGGKAQVTKYPDPLIGHLPSKPS